MGPSGWLLAWRLFTLIFWYLFCSPRSIQLYRGEGLIRHVIWCMLPIDDFRYVGFRVCMSTGQQAAKACLGLRQFLKAHQRHGQEGAGW